MFDWITGLIESIGALGVALLMLLENVFPPIPSELVMPLAGFIAAGGGASLWVMILAGTVGAVAGALFWYWVGRRLGARRLRELARRHGRWMAVSPEDIDKGNA
ncbi:MAG: DedA family protein, partial [Cereibacter changlensis]